MLRVLLVLLTAAALLRPGGAFDTFFVAGGEVHRGITSEALEGFSEESLTFVHLGNRTQDKFYFTDRFMNPAHHFTDDEIELGLAFLRSTRGEVVEQASEARRDYAAWRRALFRFGALLHAAQDFYAHSNYVEMKLASGEPLELVDWDDLPPNLTTAYFLATTVPPRELEDPARYEEVFGRKFARLEGLSPEEALHFIAEGSVAFTHAQLGKDNAAAGSRVFAAARELAVKETRRQWRLLQAELEDPLTLEKGWLHDLADGPAPGEPRNRLLELSVDDRLDTTCRVVVEPARRDRPSVRAAVLRALSFTHGPERPLARGTRGLSLVRDSGFVELTFVADPYGLEQGLGEVRLEPDGSVRLVLEASFDKVVVEVDGRVLETSGLRTAPGRVAFDSPGSLVYRPDGKLNPPDWARP